MAIISKIPAVQKALNRKALNAVDADGNTIYVGQKIFPLHGEYTPNGGPFVVTKIVGDKVYFLAKGGGFEGVLRGRDVVVFNARASNAEFKATKCQKEVSASKNSRSTNSKGEATMIKSTNAAVQKALNRKAANANTFDNTPIDRYVRDTICSKFPQSSLEGNTDGAVKYWTRGNGNKTILADKKARPALEALKAKFEPDYIFAHVDYGRGATGYSIKPRAHTKRGEFKVANALTADDGEKQKEGERTFKECQKKIAAVRREVEAAKRRLEAKKNYYCTGELGAMIQYLKYAMWEE